MMLLQLYVFISVKYRRKYLKDLNKQYGDRWCGDNPGWAPSVKSTQLHSSKAEWKRKSTHKPDDHRFVKNKSYSQQSFSVHLYKALCTITM